MAKLVMASIIHVSAGDSAISIRNSEIENEIKPLMQSYCGVPAGSKGEGLPYAPEGLPNPEDKWGWQVGKRTNLNGSWRDRFLFLPKSLTNGQRTIRFQSKLEVKNYLTETFPDLDLEKFFASFQWQVPVYFPYQTPTKSSNEEVASGILKSSNTIAVEREKRCVITDLRCLPADIRALTVAKQVNQAIRMFRRSQEREYITVRDKLLARKDILVTFLQSTSGSLSSSTLEKAFEKELENFQNMLGIAEGFGSTSREFLQHHFEKGSNRYQSDAYSGQVLQPGWIDRKIDFPSPPEEVAPGEQLGDVARADRAGGDVWRDAGRGGAESSAAGERGKRPQQATMQAQAQSTNSAAVPAAEGAVPAVAPLGTPTAQVQPVAVSAAPAVEPMVALAVQVPAPVPAPPAQPPRSLPQMPAPGSPPETDDGTELARIRSLPDTSKERVRSLEQECDIAQTERDSLQAESWVLQEMACMQAEISQIQGDYAQIQGEVTTGVSQLEAEVEKKRARADDESARADVESARADAEKAWAEVEGARVASLEAALQEVQRGATKGRDKGVVDLQRQIDTLTQELDRARREAAAYRVERDIARATATTTGIPGMSQIMADAMAAQRAATRAEREAEYYRMLYFQVVPAEQRAPSFATRSQRRQMRVRKEHSVTSMDMPPPRPPRQGGSRA